MATRYYLKNTTTSTTGLPSAEQSTKSASQSIGTAATNNVMDSTAGTTQTFRTARINNNNLFVYLGRWVSPDLAAGSISANTWTLNFAALENGGPGSGWPVDGTNKAIWINCYVWRPSGSSKVGTILDGNTAAVYDEPSAGDVHKVMHGTFSGSAVASVQASDRLIIEIWFDLTAFPNQNWDHGIAFGGSTVNVTENATVTNHAAFLETPQDGAPFAAGTTPVSQTSIQKYNISKNILQTSIQKYNLRKYLAQSSIQKYNLRNVVAITNSIQKYALLKFVAQASIHKYNMVGRVLTTIIHKYNISKTILQLSKQKYDIRQAILRASIQKYNLRQFIPQLSIHKYRMGGIVGQTSIHKYNVVGAGPIDMTQTDTKTYSNKFIAKV